jgi:nanoRNase/pAp phosphatase (c-di-AMP/oligoRNAs hydrolase)
MTSNRERTARFLNLFRRTAKVLIVINADPDAISSAMAVKRLLWRRAGEVVIAYFNKITRPDNLAMQILIWYATAKIRQMLALLFQSLTTKQFKIF